jgi:hypothetical protein
MTLLLVIVSGVLFGLGLDTRHWVLTLSGLIGAVGLFIAGIRLGEDR